MTYRSNASTLPDRARLELEAIKNAFQVANLAPAVVGPALVYTGWNGVSCGTAHNFRALEQAASQLGVRLYVINSFGVQDQGALSANRPGIPLQVPTSAESFGLLSRYGLAFQSSQVRFVNAKGQVVGPAIASSDGAQAIINAFKPYLGRGASLDSSAMRIG